MRLAERCVKEKYNELGFVESKVTSELYLYDSEEERTKHNKAMFQRGWTKAGGHKENIGTMRDPVYVEASEYYKLE